MSFSIINSKYNIRKPSKYPLYQLTVLIYILGVKNDVSVTGVFTPMA